MKSTDTVLSAIAGYVDTLGFVALFGLFTAHVTGNFVLVGAALTGHGQGVFLKLIAFPAFILGVAASRLLARGLPASDTTQGIRRLYGLQAVLMLGFCIAGLLATPARSPESGWVLAAGIIGAVAMGVQNAHSRLLQRPGVPNTVMTGNVTQAVLDAVDMLTPGIEPATRNLARERLGKMIPAIAGFGCGAITGSFAYLFAGFWALLAPTLALAWLACRRPSQAQADAQPS
jgi:uncharacterized membrane protein YoaK (UPF0700 family)